MKEFTYCDLFDIIKLEKRGKWIMKEIENNAFFWQKMDTLIFSSKSSIVWSKGETHKDYPTLVYPVNCGVLKETNHTERDEVVFFQGSQTSLGCNAVAVAVDVLNKELQVKVLLDCSADEEEKVLTFLNQMDLQKAVLIRRGNEIPNWGLTD